MNGWTGNILHIDVTTGETEQLSLPDAVYRRFLGGRGLAGYFLHRAGNITWKDPRMPLLLLAGPLVATASPTSGRMCIMSRSPLTGAVGDTSVGGRFGTALKRAGWDGLVIVGSAPRMCGIDIRDDQVLLRDARHLAGDTTSRVAERVSGFDSVAAIGPAAENGVRFANILIDGHYAAGRSGLGRVMAEKRIKYIAVAGSGRVAVADPAELKTAGEDVRRLIAASPILMGPLGISRYGTGALYDLMDNRRMMPTDNFRATRFEDAPRMNANAYQQRYRPDSRGCRGCHIRCKKSGSDGRPVPEFETMSHFSALIGNRDLEAVVRANHLCNEAGMDAISAAAAIACHREITGGALSGDALVALLEDMAGRAGDGALLAEGSVRYAQACGRPDIAMHVKGLDLPAYDPRGAYGMALAYAVSTRGACHLRAYPISHEILRKPVATDRFSFAGKARIIKISEDANAVVDSLTACKFVFLAASVEEYARVFQAVTGVPASAQDLMACGARTVYQERMINAAYGFDRDADDLPRRFFTEAGSGVAGMPVPPLDRAAFLKARSDYYQVRGLDDGGRPVPEEAERLELTWTE